MDVSFPVGVTITADIMVRWGGHEILLAGTLDSIEVDNAPDGSHGATCHVSQMSLPHAVIQQLEALVIAAIASPDRKPATDEEIEGDENTRAYREGTYPERRGK